MMGELMLLPLPLAEMNRMLFRVRSKPQLLLLSRALDSLRFLRPGTASPICP